MRSEEKKEDKKPKIRLIAVGENLEGMILEIKKQFADWGHDVFMDSGEGVPYHETIVTILETGDGKIVFTVTIENEPMIKKENLAREEIENLVIETLKLLFEKLVDLHATKEERSIGQ